MEKEKVGEKIKAELKAKFTEWASRNFGDLVPEVMKLLRTIRTAIIIAILAQVTFILVLIGLLVYWLSR